MHHICRKLDLKPGQSVVEAGCGWGGLARFMAQEYGVKVKAYNISHKQISYAHEQISNSDLSDQVEYIEDDYRNITGNYDVFVSVGMLEHIGVEYYQCLGSVINNCLNDKGHGLIHSIGRNKPGLLNAWIEARIFPGACPPSLGQMMQIFEPYSLSILDIENLRLHYAKTLEHWIKRFDTKREVIQKMYDKSFVRSWNLYLMGSKAAFTSGTMQLFQVLFTRPKNNDLRWSRSHLYLKQ
jgi:cyclopropane-fatty-acyl-phospholipid synthase